MQDLRARVLTFQLPMLFSEWVAAPKARISKYLDPLDGIFSWR